MLETDNGYAILVKATVDKAASRDDDDDDDDESEDLVVKGTGFTYNVTQKTITVESNNEAGLQNLLTGSNEVQEITDARDSGFDGVTIELAAGSYSVKDTFGDENTPFMGILKGKSPDEKATITLTGGKGLFTQIGEYSSGPENNGTVENITFEVQTNITNTFTPVGNCCAGAVAGSNNGTITNCEVKLNDHTINASGNLDFTNAGGLVGLNYGTITDCTVTIINGSISATSDSTANAGGIAGDNEGEIKGNSQVTLNGGTITATGESDARAGGLAGQNAGTVTGNWTPQISNLGTIQATVGGSTASVPNDDDDNPNTDTQGRALAGTKIGFDWRAGGPVGS